MEPTQTALIVPVPEAEPAVGRFRASLDRAASWGVPAHVTVLYPFLPPQLVDDQVLAALRDIVAGVPRFDIVLTHVDWFGDTVVWVAPAGSSISRSHRSGVATLPRDTPVRRHVHRDRAAPDYRSGRSPACAGPRREGGLHTSPHWGGRRGGPAHRRDAGLQPLAHRLRIPARRLPSARWVTHPCGGSSNGPPAARLDARPSAQNDPFGLAPAG
jgi:2'-5' RNA ligase superfamily